MTGFFVCLYQYCHPLHEQKLLNRVRFYSVLRLLVRVTANLVLPVWYVVTRKSSYRTSDDSEIIVTMTSFPSRIGKVWMAVESILRQTVLPYRVILWLSKEQFPKGRRSLPKRLLDQCERGLEIVFCDGDLRSHKKYAYLLSQTPRCHMVTVDDDIFYDEHLLERLQAQHRLYPKDVIAAYTHQMTFDQEGQLKPYSQWHHHTTASENLFFGSGGGTYFPPGVLYREAVDAQKAITLCPTADDVWLNAQTRLAGHRVRRIPQERPYHFVEIIRLRDTELADNNVYSEHKNDEQISAVCRAYADVMNPLFYKE